MPNGTLFGDGVCGAHQGGAAHGVQPAHDRAAAQRRLRAVHRASRRTCCSSTAPGRRRTIWYYEQPLPEGRKNYTKTAPLQFEEFAATRAWWTQREEGPQSWQVSADDVAAKGFNLDLKNPNARTALAHADPKELVASMRGHEAAVLRLLGEIDALVSGVDA